MSQVLPVPLVTVSGPPAECGTAYGALAAERIAANLDAYGRRFAIVAGLDRDQVAHAGEVFRGVTREYHPRIADLLDGVAAGARVPRELVFALNARTELLCPAGGPPDGADGGCTSIGVLGTHTAGGHLLLGQNWDWYPDQRDTMVLLHTTDERGHRVLTLTEAGMLAKTGLNSTGVGVCVNLLGCDRDGLGRGRPVGVPYHVLLRATLEADSLALALRAAIRPPRSSSINVLLGQGASGHTGTAGQADPTAGELIDVEIVPGDAAWLHPVDGLLTHANHFEGGLNLYDTIKDWGGSSLFRSARARRLLAGAAADRKVTEDDLAAAFRDHASYPMSICRHIDERDAPIDRSETVHSVLLDLDGRRLGVAAGPPCGHEYTWLDLPT